jgi:serine/threonine protein phosphatase PrpC
MIKNDNNQTGKDIPKKENLGEDVFNGMGDNNQTGKNNFENSLIIDIPKKENFGEDAPPLFVVSDDKQRSVVGVFDGMGGLGNRPYEENGETHTGAYLASREVKTTVEQFFKERINDENFSITQNDVDLLKGKIIDSLKEKLSKQHYEESSIKGTLSPTTFPTTMAVGDITQCDNKLKIKLFWAGDSRVYLLSASKGLIQLTKDDLRVHNDPFQNIQNDSPLSNKINLDEDFCINFNEAEEITPALFFAATDGCFQFFSTPMHFENFVLQTMQDASSMNEWQQKITEILKNISGDDCSIALVCLTEKEVDFITFKELFRTRSEFLYQDFMCKISEKDKIVADLEKEQNAEEFALRETERKELYERLWFKYKETNYSLF